MIKLLNIYMLVDFSMFCYLDLKINKIWHYRADFETKWGMVGEGSSPVGHGGDW